MLTMDVGHEVLRALGQIENGLEVDNLGARAVRVREHLRENLQHPEVGRGYLFFCKHDCICWAALVLHVSRKLSQGCVRTIISCKNSHNSLFGQWLV